MKLVQKVEKNELLGSSWGIYELDPDEKKKYGNNYALSQGVFLTMHLKNLVQMNCSLILKNLLMKAFLKHKKKHICRLNWWKCRIKLREWNMQ